MTDLRYFEQSIPESILRSAYRMIQQHQVVSAGHSGHVRSFECARNHAELHIEGHKLVKARCSCGQKQLCRHVAAALLYMQKSEGGETAKAPAALAPFDDIRRKVRLIVRGSADVKSNSARLKALSGKTRAETNAAVATLAVLTELERTIAISRTYSAVVERCRKHLSGLKKIRPIDTDAWIRSLTICAHFQQSETFRFLLPLYLTHVPAAPIPDVLWKAIEKGRGFSASGIEWNLVYKNEVRLAIADRRKKQKYGDAAAVIAACELTRARGNVKGASRLLIGFLSEYELPGHGMLITYALGSQPDDTLQRAALRAQIVTTPYLSRQLIDSYRTAAGRITPADADDMIKVIGRQPPEIAGNKTLHLLAASGQVKAFEMRVARNELSFMQLHQMVNETLLDNDAIRALYTRTLLKDARRAATLEIKKRLLGHARKYRDVIKKV